MSARRRYNISSSATLGCEESAIHKKWTIEIIADFSDKGKNDAIDAIVKQKAAELLATVLLLGDIIKPQVAAFSDDFFVGRTDLDMLAHNTSANIPLPGDTTDIDTSEEISDELLQAMRDMQGNR